MVKYLSYVLCDKITYVRIAMQFLIVTTNKRVVNKVNLTYLQCVNCIFTYQHGVKFRSETVHQTMGPKVTEYPN
jgi:hypothetical protein